MLSELTLRNFKIYDERGVTARLAHVTILLGPNSAGKSTLMHALQVLRQSWAGGEFWRFVVEGAHAKLGDFRNVVHGHDTSREIVMGLGFTDEGNRSRHITLTAAADAEGSRVTKYHVRPWDDGVDRGDHAAGVVLREGTPPDSLSTGGVWFRLDAESMRAWYSAPETLEDLTWWVEHDEYVTVLLRSTSRALEVHVITDVKPPTPTAEPKFDDRPSEIGRQRWGRRAIPVGSILGQQDAERAWADNVRLNWPRELVVQEKEAQNPARAFERWMRDRPMTETSAVRSAMWQSEWELRQVEYAERRDEESLRLADFELAHAAWRTERDATLAAWDQLSDEIRQAAAAWRERAESPRSALNTLLRRPVDDALTSAVAQVAGLSFVGGLRLPGERWTEISGVAVSSVGPDGADLAGVLANPSAKARERVNQALRGVGVGYQMEVVNSVSFERGAPPAVYLQLVHDMASGESQRTGGATRARVGLRDVGSGIRQMIPVLAEYEMLIREGRALGLAATLFVEQPELHLHPRLQGDLVTWLAGFERVTSDSEVSGLKDWVRRNALVPQVVLETHGEVMVRRVARLIGSGHLSRSDVSLLVVHTPPSCSVEITEVAFFENGEIDWHLEDLGFFDDAYREMD